MKITQQPSAGSGLLDVADGIARVMGDRALYARMLGRFRDDYRHGVASIRGAIAGGDLPLAHRLAHTLKGAAGMISAPALQRHASALELALRIPASGQAALIDTLDDALAALLAAIGPVLADQPARAPQQPAAEAVLAQLAALLASGDGSAVDVLERSGASLKVLLGEAGFDAVARAAHQFDFEGALAAIGRIGVAERGTAAGA